MRFKAGNTVGLIAATCLFFLMLTGCAFLQISEEARIIQESAIIVGKVSGDCLAPDTSIMVAAYLKKGDRRTVVHYTSLHQMGPYELLVGEGNYQVAAFIDRNHNLVYDRGEPVGQYMRPEGVVVPSGGVVVNTDIVVSNVRTDKIDIPIGFTLPPKEWRAFHSTSPGALISLDDPLYSDEYGSKGFWAGMEFYREIGGNIYFLEPYDPKKIPILFVHGAAGSPQNWKSIVGKLDRDRFQPWFFYYPSGASLNSMSYLLLWKLLNLQEQYKFSEIYITAHSMGGLVVRSFLVNFGQLFPTVTKFISISTPWGGEELASSGVKYSPAVIPAWRDMQPQSEFIASIYSRTMPPTLNYYLFFGHKGDRNPLRPNNDTTVTLASQLDLRQQREAKKIYGFNEDHMSILSDKQVLSQYNAILDEDYAKTAGQAAAGNRLRVDFSYDLPPELPRPTAALLLRSVDEQQSETWLYLSPEESGKAQGPFSPGNYEVSLLANAFRPEPAVIPVTVGEGEAPRIEFKMKPVGTLFGYVADAGSGLKQAGVYQKPDTEVEIRYIKLRGKGIERTLVPLKGEPRFPDYYLSGEDYLSKGTFFFFGLPTGKYEVTVNAKGYEPCTEVRVVRPGQYENDMIVELVKEQVVY